MGRTPCCDKTKVKRGPWSPEEDQILKKHLLDYGTGGNWITLPQKAGLKRCGKSCRLRWLNYLRPDIKHGPFTPEEDNLICTLYSKMGSRWSIIASQLRGRTDNDVKNHWNSKLKKKQMAASFRKPASNTTNDNSSRPASFTSTTSTTTPYSLETQAGAFHPNFSAHLSNLSTEDYTDISVGTEGSKVCSSSSKTIEYMSSSSQAQEDSIISESTSFGTITNTINNSMPWLDDYGAIDRGLPMEMTGTAAYSYEILSGIWPQETVLEALHDPYF
ncbi:uncharacterized protein [Coffea arabica]|uniref:Transcription factor RAX2-like n=1 Tax=Coffea arabica TaxID=13443 RepID=A0A6P6TWT4_COFAR|nr:transcription factor RAX2-like [Coffea arabica]